MAAVELVGLAKAFAGGVVGLQPTTLDVAAGGCVALIGPTGSGKSTLLRLVAGLEVPTAGEVRIAGRRVDRLPPHRRGVSLLPQRVALYPHRTVRDNLAGGTAFPPVAGLLDRFPHQLSGGQRQLVGLAKLAARRRPVWLLDEPFTGLDADLRERFRADLHLFRAETAATILIVTHDPADVSALADRVAVLRAGAVVQLGTPAEVRARPRDRFAAVAFAGLCLLDGTATGDGDPGGFTAAGGAAKGDCPRGSSDNLALGFRPEDLLPVPAAEPPPPHGVAFCDWPVVSAEPVGSGWRLTLALGGCRVRAGVATGSPPPVGTVTRWHLPPDRCHWFRGDTGERLGG
jgi:ABC-type sugar transport system ATPase subunit